MKNTAIKENHLYAKTFQKGKRFSGQYVSVFVLKDQMARRLMKANPEKKYLNRVGLSVSKKLGGSVQRNRAKRVMRAGWQMALDRAEKAGTPVLRGYLIVICPREPILSVKSPEVGRELFRALKKIGMLSFPTVPGEETAVPQTDSALSLKP